MLPPERGSPRGELEPHVLHEFFESALARHPQRVAVDVPPGRGRPTREVVTYAELDRAARRVTTALTTHVRGECIVALFLPRMSHHLFAAQLGTLRAGAGFACIDPAFPDGHVFAILEDARPAVVITDAAGRERLARASILGGIVLEIGAVLKDGAADPDPVRPKWLGASTLAYVIYTSGTTGRPKGVMIEHAGIASLVASDVELFRVNPDDRIAQGSSAAYDSSIEETWLAWAAGATLVVMDDDAARAGPDLVTWLGDERISVLCPTPTLLRATGCKRPRAMLPHLKLVYTGGEALPRDVADAWADGIRLENGYGPTECSVTVLRAPVRRGEPITIGKPVPNSRAFVLDENLDEVAPGETGELCIAGLGLARGYLGREDLTAERFPVHATLGRLYRTGDRARRDGSGDHHYLGRIDAQVKLRGYRVELGAIEALLVSQPGVRSAACCVQGEGSAQVLVAHVVPSDVAHPPDLEALRDAARAELPIYMVPARCAFLAALPTLPSGKLDRAALPAITAWNATEGGVLPRDPIEACIAAAFRAVLGAATVPSVAADFFLELGGDSLRAAEVVSLLRENATTSALTVRDLYEARTAAELALRARRASQPNPQRAQYTALPPRSNRPSSALATLAHVAWLFVTLVVASSILYTLGVEFLTGLVRDLDLVPFLLLAPALALLAAAAYTLVAVTATVALKWLLIGRFRPTRAPVWGGLHVRTWIVKQVAASVPWTLLQDTVFLNAVLRMLGARIGRRVHLHRGVELNRGGWDLLEIGDDATVSQEAALRLVEVEDGEVVFGTVKIGARSLLDIRAGIGPDAQIGEDAVLGPLAWLPPGGRVPAGEVWNGVPARRTGLSPALPNDAVGQQLPPAVHGLATIVARFLRAAVALWIPFLLLAALVASIPHFGVENALTFVFAHDAARDGLWIVLALVVASAPLSAIVSALTCRALGPVRPGVISRWSFGYLRVLAKCDALNSAGELLSGTLFWPLWLRLAGMRVGRNCEISTLLDVVPELVEIGDECFLADGIYLGGPRVRTGTVTLARTRLSNNTFLGNHCVVPAGTELPPDVLVGVSTVADDTRVRPGTSWFGLPPMELPRRPPPGLDRRLTHDPGWLRYTSRLVWETARFFLPIAPTLVVLVWMQTVAFAHEHYGAALFQFVLLPGATLAAGVTLCLAVLILKWTLIGRVRPGEHALWSFWCSRWDFLYMAWGQWARPLLARLEGTQLLAWYLRAMGSRVGRRVLLEAGFAHVVDPDMLVFEDDATVGCLFQAHTFEDRMLKMDHVTIRRGAWVGPGTVMFYGADVGPGARVAPHGVVMKHERLPGGGYYVGSPVTEVRA